MAVFAAVFAALYAAHMVGDHWVQRSTDAVTKGQPGWTGRRACAHHVATYTATGMVALWVLAKVTGWQPDMWPTIAGLAVSAVSHYIADRRTPLRWLADRIGKDPQWLDHGGGMYALDQSFHVLFLFIAALIIA